MIDLKSLDRCLSTAVKVGCPQEQMTRFIKAGYIPQPRQLEFHAAARLADSANGPDRIGYGGTRGQAKSHATLAQVVIDDLQRRPGLKALYLRKIQRRAYESFEDLRRKVLAFTPHEHKQGLLRLPNGSFVILGGFAHENDVDSYLGLEYDVIVLEDATTLSKTKYNAIRGALRTGRSDWRPRLYANANPGGIGHAWYAQEFLTNQSGETQFIHTKMGDNVFINPEYENYLNSLTGFLRRSWRDGDFSIAAGQFFRSFSETTHVIKPLNHVPLDWTFIGGLDYGYRHPTVAYLMAQSGDGNVYALAEHYAARTPVEIHAKAIHKMIADFGLRFNQLNGFVAGGDAFTEDRKGSTVARDYAREGIKLTAANWARVQGGREFQKRLGDPDNGIEPSFFIFDTCPRLIWTIPQMIHDPRRQEDVLKFDADDNGDYGDDPYDAGRYILMEFARGPGKLEYTRENPFA